MIPLSPQSTIKRCKHRHDEAYMVNTDTCRTAVWQYGSLAATLAVWQYGSLAATLAV